MTDKLDAELLALAGDDSEGSGDDASPPASRERGRPKKEDRSSESGSASEGEPADGDADEDEDADADGDENGAEEDANAAAEKDDGPLFPYEKLFYSAKDKADIMSRPEIQREELLSERAAQVDRHNQDVALRRLLASRAKDESAKQVAGASSSRPKRKAGVVDDDDLDDSQRKSTRQKTTVGGGRRVGEASGAIEAYKRQREQKKRDDARRRDRRGAHGGESESEDDRSRESDRRSRSRSQSRSVSVESGERSDESEHERGSRRQRHSPPSPPATLRDLERARVGRSNFAMVCFYPGFDDAIAGCYTRIVIGVNRDTGMNEYRICQIKKFTEGKPYAIEGRNGRSFITNQYALCAHGKAEKEFPFITASDSPFTEAEFGRYRQTLLVEHVPFPTQAQLARKVADINGLLNHQFTSEELNEKLRRQGVNDTKTAIYSRIQLEKKRSSAIASGDERAVASVDAELQQRTAPKLAFGTSLSRPSSSKPDTNTLNSSTSTPVSEQDRLYEMNRRNQRLNAASVRAAQIEERRCAKAVAAAVARGEAAPDRFARVRTQARTHYDVSSGRLAASNKDGAGSSSQSQSRTNTPVAGAKKEGEDANGNELGGGDRSNKNHSASPAPSSARGSVPPTKKGVLGIRHRPTDDENIAALDFELDIEV